MYFIVNVCTLSFHFILYLEQLFMFLFHETYGPIFQFLVNNKILIFYSTGYGSIFLSVVIALERCVCVLVPLRAKLLLTTKNMAVIIVIGVSLVNFPRLVILAKYAMVCFYDKSKQITYMGVYITDYATKNKELLDFLDRILYKSIILLGCPIIVFIATVITTVKLWKTVAFKKEMLSKNTRKEAAVTKMLILLSLEFVAFALSKVLLETYPLFASNFGTKGKNRYFFLSCISTGEVFLYMGSSFSFIIYYYTSLKYRKICLGLFRRKCCLKD